MRLLRKLHKLLAGAGRGWLVPISIAQISGWFAGEVIELPAALFTLSVGHREPASRSRGND